MAQRKVARLEPLDVAQHLGFRLMLVKDGMREVRAGPAQVLRDGALDPAADVIEHERQRFIEREDGDQVGHVAQARGLVERHAEPRRGDDTQVDLA